MMHHIDKFRPTVDIDMMGTNINSDPEHLKDIIREILQIDLYDAVHFDGTHIAYDTIKEGAEYEGLRFSFMARLGKIKSKMRIDIGFGDAVPGGFVEERLPTLLEDLELQSIMQYPIESVIAEKFQAIVYLGYANSRMKDFYDIIFLAHSENFSLSKLKAAIEATFSRRETDIERREIIYSSEYNKQKRILWKAFLRKLDKDVNDEFYDVIKKLKLFLDPVITSENDNKIWQPELWKWLK